MVEAKSIDMKRMRAILRNTLDAVMKSCDKKPDSLPAITERIGVLRSTIENASLSVEQMTNMGMGLGYLGFMIDTKGSNSWKDNYLQFRKYTQDVPEAIKEQMIDVYRAYAGSA